MSPDTHSPDRRPLVYGGVALLILLAAAFLFWPHGDDDPTPTRMVLTPESVREDNPGSATTDAATGTLAAAEESVPVDGIGSSVSSLDETVELPAETLPRGETRIVDSTPKATQPTPVAAQPKPRQTETRTSSPQRTAPSSPLAEGRYVLNVGSFSTQSNADTQARELIGKGLNAHVHAAAKDDGTIIYRVRVGYFESRSVAESYGSWLKRQYSLDSWASGR